MVAAGSMQCFFSRIFVAHGSIGSGERVPRNMHVIGHDVGLGEDILDLVNLNLLNLVRTTRQCCCEWIEFSGPV